MNEMGKQPSQRPVGKKRITITLFPVEDPIGELGTRTRLDEEVHHFIQARVPNWLIQRNCITELFLQEEVYLGLHFQGFSRLVFERTIRQTSVRKVTPPDLSRPQPKLLATTWA